jgi:uncharacterized repeat protein (TIGR02543 family)
MKTQKSTVFSILFAVLAVFCFFTACEQPDDAVSKPADSVPQVAAKPSATPAGGSYTSAQTVTLATTTAGADIYYTLDGTDPTINSTKYSSAITINATSTLKAFAVKTGMTNSDILTAIYSISCTVTFYADGGTPAPASPVTMNPGSTITQPSAMTKAWHTFGGWYTDSAYTVSAVFPITVNGNVNLYARWIVNTLNSVDDVKNYLTSLPNNTINNPANLTVNINLGTMTAADSGWQQLLDAVNTAGKYVNLDLSLCTMTGTSFDPVSSVTTGKNRIVSIILPTAATSIPGSSSTVTFNNFSNLKSISGANITAINLYAFADCTNLQSVNLPQATSVGNSAFKGCTGLQNVNISASATLSSEGNPFIGCTSLASFSLSGSGTTLSVIENGRALAQQDGTLIAYPSASGAITMNTITSIASYAFEGCTSLQSVDLPQATSMGLNAFKGCTSLRSVDLPQATYIGINAFEGCTTLQSLNIPTVTTIYGYAFMNTGTATLSITMGSVAPGLSDLIFYQTAAPKTVIVKIPTGATGYSPASSPFSGTAVTVSGTDAAANWGNGFRGGGWNGTMGTGSINQNISVIIQQ